VQRLRVADKPLTCLFLTGALLGFCLLPIQAQESGTASAPKQGDLIDVVYMSYFPMRSVTAKDMWENLRKGVRQLEDQEPKNQKLQMLALVIEGEIARTSRQLDVAQREFQQANELSSGDSLPFLGMAETRLDQGYFDGGVTINLLLAEGQVSESVPTDFQHSCYTRIGELFERAGKYTGAVREYELAVAKKPDWGQGQRNLARIYLTLNESDKALEHAQKALALEPNEPSGYSILGDAQNRLGRKNLALDALRKAVELDPGNALFHYELGLEYESQGSKIFALRSYLTAKNLTERTKSPADLVRNLDEAIARVQK
jgi:tetratricopeptide (TPR) repeat protein